MEPLPHRCSVRRRRAPVPTLHSLALRHCTLHLFGANARWRSFSDISRDVIQQLRRYSIPLGEKRQIYAGLRECFAEVKRWDDKHSQMFPDQHRQPGRVQRSEHLRMFHDSLIWKQTELRIDDYRTARAIMDGPCRDWPQVRFQIACCYAMKELLEAKFDKVRRKVFRDRLCGHPVYELWLRLLDNPREWKRVFRDDRVLVDQQCVQAIHFAFLNGFVRLARFLWVRLTPQQRETVGCLAWKKICFRANSPEIIRFVCRELCQLNPVGMARLTWDSFYFKVCESLEHDDKDGPVYAENMRKLRILLENWCPTLRREMLSRNNCRAITDAFWLQRPDTFALLLDHVQDSETMRSAREHVDRIYEKKRTEDMGTLRRALLRRQETA